MKISRSICLISYPLFVIICSFSLKTASAFKHDSQQGFLQCLFSHNYNSISNLTYTRKNSSYLSVLDATIKNLRFTSPSTRKPLAIITPLHEYQIQPVVYCSKEYGIQIRVRSGGHDYEGLSYTSQVPFVIIDLINLRSIDIDVESGTAWVQSGATVIELYNAIANKSGTLGFPAAIAPTVGIGGHFSGGGYGAMLRKYGLAGDNVIDARLIDVKGKMLDRESMGEDLFWAIRGGTGGNFGIVPAWKIKLVPVPKNVTVFAIQKTFEQNATQIIHRWQSVAPNLHEDLFLSLTIAKAASNGSVDTAVQSFFTASFLGGVDRLVPMMEESFPELGLVKEDCIGMSWIESVAFFAANTPTVASFKGKSDYVKDPIPLEAIEGMWSQILEEDATVRLFFIPYGGKMNEFSESALPFPHRAGNLFHIHYGVYWDEEGAEASKRHINWSRKLYKYMTPYVSKYPREAYANYRDLDLGMNNKDNTSYAQASIWGRKYFKNNFHRLAEVKTVVDPTNFFRHEQSIPLLPSSSKKKGQSFITQGIIYLGKAKM